MPPPGARLPSVAFTTLVEPLAGLWRRRVGSAVRHTLLALSFACLFGAAHLARVGTQAARLGAAGMLVGFVAFLIVRSLRERRAWADTRRALARVLRPSDPVLAGRALRAYSLLQRAEAGDLAASPDLAELHFRRLLAQAPPQVIERSAGRRARRWRWALLGVAGLAAVAFGVGPMRVVEGLDVLVARGQVAPLPLVWLHYPTLTMQPPAYLRTADRMLLLDTIAELPKGALVTVRGKPTRPGRILVLTDGDSEVPFVSDGAGGVVARWTVDTDAKLVVGARFGDVLVVEPEGVDLRAKPDLAPVVVVEGAPREISLHEVGRVALHYEAGDDHGLSQVDLVLRAGHREDRRVLSRFNGDTRTDRGGHALAANDPFLRRMFLPILVTVEARDNDPLDGPKWGRSEPVTLIPPPLGEPEAQRMQALVSARDALVDLLAWQLAQDASAAESERRLDLVVKTIEASVDPDAPLPVADGLRSFLLGQIRALTSAPRPGTSRTRRTEDVLLAVDVAVQRLAVRDARSVALRLADVADEVAAGAREARETEQPSRAIARLRAALAALEAGTEQLLALGELGRDLGSVAQGDTDRIRRSQVKDDLLHAELAAKHLAARLRRPNPSFATKRTGGVESGGGMAADAGEASQADQRFDELARELEHLALEHAGEIGQVERALGDAEQRADASGLRDEARRRAEDLRRAVAALPAPGAEPGSARSSAAIGREHAGAMSQSLEQLALKEAVESGKRALSNLEEAERKARERRYGLSDWLQPELVQQARRQLREQVAWAEDKMAEVRRQAEAEARDALRDSGHRERQHAQRAGNLSSRGRNDQASLPGEVLQNLERAESLMNDAARELQEGRGERALQLQRDAQRLLEQASQGRTTDDSSRRHEGKRAEDLGRGGMETKGEVPSESGDGAQDFRQRVMRGLGSDHSGMLAPAIRRYAEGLLR
jgi:hypothetical protein